MLLDLAPLGSSLTDERGIELLYDEAAVTVVGRTDRVAPGAGFVVVARCTLAHLRHRRVVRHSVAVRASTSAGTPIEHRAGLEVRLGPGHAPTVRFTPMITGRTGGLR